MGVEVVLPGGGMVVREGGSRLRHHLCGSEREIGQFRHRGEWRGKGKENENGRERGRERGRKTKNRGFRLSLRFCHGLLESCLLHLRSMVSCPLFLYLLLQLTAAGAGPVFRTEDLMNLFRNAVIPSSTRSKSPPPRAGQSSVCGVSSWCLT